jgi:hypothetical protein
LIFGNLQVIEKNKDDFMLVVTKDDLIKKLRDIRNLGWIENLRVGNAGSIGNMLEDLLGIKENNLAIANAGEWELKTKRKNSSSLTTLLHNEPSPRKAGIVANLLLPFYGWQHQEAGHKYPNSELSFRQTICCKRFSDRGFTVELDRENEKIIIRFDASKIDPKHNDWLKKVDQRIGLGNLNPEPYWGFRDLSAHIGSKLTNCFFILVDVKKENGKEYLQYNDIKMLSNFSMNKFIDTFEDNLIYIDFDARTGHNHGTKFRIRETNLPLLYDNVTQI